MEPLIPLLTLFSAKITCEEIDIKQCKILNQAQGQEKPHMQSLLHQCGWNMHHSILMRMNKVASDLKNEERLCVICIETFTKEQDIWSCKVCSCVLHFSCVEKWSTVSKDSYGRWRCPGCRNSYSHIPTKKCFCGKRTEMKNETDEDFFSCGLKCGKPLLPKKVSTYWICPHVCRRVCHPGPCGKCMSFAAAPCYCGQIVKMGNCSELDNDRSVLFAEAVASTVAIGPVIEVDATRVSWNQCTTYHQSTDDHCNMAFHTLCS
ncbi:NF-X1-type zinc finger protein NFXL1 [Trichinella papuae]|uniref:NF-X1-type zinc finger protein NFXL1 n=1 Tax=Trichinella papuae TaxID=268474 RepID=A0A0V1N7G9_9BILA|nr:NF-X1-type zinc finger protein NFXL1 [Trichinella papuae]